MNRPFRNAAIPSLALALASACVTAPKRLESLSPSEVVPGEQTVVALAYQLDGFKGADGDCLLEVEERDSRARYVFSLSPGRQAALIDLPPGAYVGKQLHCPGLSTRWKIDRFWADGIEPVDGKVNFAGFFKGTLVRTPSGTTMRTQSSDRPATSEAARKLIEEMPPAWSPHWVSVSTGRPIRKSMFPSGEKTYGLKFKTEFFSKQEGLTSAPLQEEIKACERHEAETNPLLLGDLSYSARYEGGKLAEFRKVSEDEAFREDFPRCIESAMRSYQPSFQDKMEFRVTY